MMDSMNDSCVIMNFVHYSDLCRMRLERLDNSFIRGILFLSMQIEMQGEKRSKVGHLASIFDAAGAFLYSKSYSRMNGEHTWGFQTASLEICL